MNIKPLLLSTYDIKGGASRATFRLHRALNTQSSMLVVIKDSDDYAVQGIQGIILKSKRLLYAIIEEQFVKLQRTTNQVLHSPERLTVFKAKELNDFPFDLVHLNWTGKTCISIEEIARINKPILWTLHDMWAFCGAEHYALDEPDSRWRNGYTKNNRNPLSKGLDLNRWTWQRKKKHWKEPINLVVPSQWLAHCVKESRLMNDWPVTVIPNLLDTNVFKTTPKQIARKILNLPLTNKLILFGAIGGMQDSRKGWDLLEVALLQLNSSLDVSAVIFGQSKPLNPPNIRLKLHWMGHIHDDITLALIYSAADVMIVPSRQEAFGQTASEAHACSCPVVAFNATGLKDIVVHKKTGYLANAYDTNDLANGIRWILEDSERYKQLSRAARKRAIKLWSPEVVVPQYLKVYQQAIEQHKSND